MKDIRNNEDEEILDYTKELEKTIKELLPEN